MILDKTHRGWRVATNVLKAENSLALSLPVLDLVRISLGRIGDCLRWVLVGIFVWRLFIGWGEVTSSSVSVVGDVEFGVAGAGKVDCLGNIFVWCMSSEYEAPGRTFKFWTFEGKGNDRGREDIPINWLRV